MVLGVINYGSFPFVCIVGKWGSGKKLCIDMDPCVKVGGENKVSYNTSGLSSRFTTLNSSRCFKMLIGLWRMST